MPHYTDGTQAKVGDQVIGKLYNTAGARAGTIISITPGVETCNAMVQFTEAKLMENGIMPEPPRMTVFCTVHSDEPTKPQTRVVKGEQHGSTGATFVLFTCADYCAVNELTKV